ncbi:HTH-type transcriptional regulator BenM [Streptomyces hundungensis]|uniref:HTH-type transcriptional regulator BenM n=1 Tax=Streptomyces hundungensis TaxID=1077946 RepID=A0A387H9G4_9ACTN|nr:LysR family transcriptional regulator [Streptomyces hundungensis]AYG78853.1 HTH-type transcriptional regulator BenM [Streptomyces hundungensis]
MLERLELEAFLTLAEELHFGRTAERLHLTTGRISQSIKKLERHIGTPLFERTSRYVRLTPAGRQLHEDLLPPYEQLRAGLHRAVDAAQGIQSVLRVGFVGAASGQLMVHAAQLYAERHPGHRAQPRELQIADSYPRLRDGDVDLLIVSLPHQEAGTAVGPVLYSERRMLAVSREHPLAGRESVSLEDLTAVKLLQARSVPTHWRTARTPLYTPAGHPVEAGPEFETFQEALALIGADQGAFIVGAQAMHYYARSDVAYLPFSDAPPLEWAPVWLTARAAPRIHDFNRAALDAATRIHLAAAREPQPSAATPREVP